MRKSLYLILLLLILGYFSFFFYRLLITRIPQDPLVMTGLIVLVLLTIKIFKILIKVSVLLYKKIKKQEQNKTEQEHNAKKTLIEKIFNYLREKDKELEDFFYKFTRDFLWQSKTFSKISIYFCTIFIKFRPFPKKIVVPIVLIPWMIFVLIFFVEVLFFDSLYLALYFLTLNFLIQKLFDVFLFLLVQEFKFFLNNSLHNNFFIFQYSFELPIREFFLINRNIQCQWFFYNEKLQNKKILKHLWKAFTELFFFNANFRILTDFLKPDKTCLLTFTRKTNLIIYGTTFFGYLLTYSFDFFEITVPDIFIALLVFFASWLIFLRWLDFLRGTEEDLLYRNYFLASPALFLDFYQGSLEGFRNEMLQKFSFLSETDLKDYVLPENFHLLRFIPFVDYLTDEENDLITEYQEVLMNSFRKHVFKGNLIMPAFAMKQELPADSKYFKKP